VSEHSRHAVELRVDFDIGDVVMGELFLQADNPGAYNQQSENQVQGQPGTTCQKLSKKTKNFLNEMHLFCSVSWTSV
jgi:hypothetical protein